MKVSAPAGHSEHHTGFALDIADGNDPTTFDLVESFEKTIAFRWLQKNASKYGFHLSFERNNKEGVAYEPWHWHWQGNQLSQSIFSNKKIS